MTTERAIQMEETRLGHDEYDETFASYVTSTAFDLRLSKSMIAYLIETAMREKYNRQSPVLRMIGAPDNWIASKDALRRRGLIRQFDSDNPGHDRMTDAGRLVLGLLKIAGFLTEDTERIWHPESNSSVFRKSDEPTKDT